MTHTPPESRPLSGLAAHYSRVLSEHSASGLSLSEFAARRGISVTSLYRWRRRLESPNPDAPFDGGGNSLLAVDLIGSAHHAVSDARYEIELSNGIVLRFGPDFEPTRVADLLTLVRAC